MEERNKKKQNSEKEIMNALPRVNEWKEGQIIILSNSIK